jgi:cyclopropane fatty-acyl-phospholipid synthase-like methyltransferase
LPLIPDFIKNQKKENEEFIMKKLTLISIIILTTILSLTCQHHRKYFGLRLRQMDTNKDGNVSQEEWLTKFKDLDSNGDRVISEKEMHYSKAKMFNEMASAPESQSDKILEVLALKTGQNIADIGAGGGFFTLRFAKAVGKK